jgi:hypothetical protein
VLKEAGVELSEEQTAKVAAALKPAEKAAEPEKAPEAGDKQAAGPNLELTTDVLAKIAAHILSTSEGAEYVEGFLAKEAGAEQCREILSFLADQSELAEKQAAYDAGQADAAALYEQAVYQRGVADGQKTAAAPQADPEVSFYEKLGQAVADASMADPAMADPAMAGMMGGAPGEEMGGDAVSPEELQGGAEGAGGELAGDEQVSPEELMGALEELVAEGTISEDEAAQVLEYIQAGGAEGGGEMGGEAPGGEMAPEMGGEAPPMGGEEEVPAGGGGEGDEGAEIAPKEASAKAADLLAAIQSVRQASK